MNFPIFKQHLSWESTSLTYSSFFFSLFIFSVIRVCYHMWFTIRNNIIFFYIPKLFFYNISSHKDGWVIWQHLLYNFFTYLTIGSILLAGILALIYLLTNDAIKKITGHNDLLLLSLIPSIYLFLYSDCRPFINTNHRYLPGTSDYGPFSSNHSSPLVFYPKNLFSTSPQQ